MYVNKSDFMKLRITYFVKGNFTVAIKVLKTEEWQLKSKRHVNALLYILMSCMYSLGNYYPRVHLLIVIILQFQNDQPLQHCARQSNHETMYVCIIIIL